MFFTDKSKVSTMSRGYTAFTLAEVLITIGVIGVVAAITIPALMNKTNDKETVTALKKAYSTLSQAYTLAVQDNGTPDTWGLTAATVDPDIINNLIPYLNVSKNCIGQANCNPNITLLELDGGTTGYWNDYFNTRPTVTLSDGSILTAVYVHNATCTNVIGSTSALKTECAAMNVDVNGFKKPNQMGVDNFVFYLTKYGIVPVGTKDDTYVTFNTYCKDKSSAIAENGDGCTAWVIQNENMDYLKCNNLDWNGPTKCN